jgi:hypothetical protein
MTDTVYVLGAGFNKSIVAGENVALPPPTALDFFQHVLSASQFKTHRQSISDSQPIDELFELIAKYWHMSESDLLNKGIDIEAVLTLLEQQQWDAESKEIYEVAQRGASALRVLLADYLADVSIECSGLPRAIRFGLRVLEEGADVLTFNYDSVAEDAIAIASGLTGASYRDPLPDGLEGLDRTSTHERLLKLSQLPWKVSLASGFQFHELSVPVDVGVGTVGSADYYATPNDLYETIRVLKLHGSINWWKSSETHWMGQVRGDDINPSLRASVESNIHWLTGANPTSGSWLNDPVIVPPMLYKRFEELPLPQIWSEARSALATCRRLIIVGYSFPPTDFRTKRLFLEAFCDTSRLEEVLVVNPTINSEQTVGDLTNFEGRARRLDDLEAYLNT